jgi:hypothetical protein
VRDCPAPLGAANGSIGAGGVTATLKRSGRQCTTYVPSGFNSLEAAWPPSVMNRTVPAPIGLPPSVTEPETIAARLSEEPKQPVSRVNTRRAMANRNIPRPELVSRLRSGPRYLTASFSPGDWLLSVADGRTVVADREIPQNDQVCVLRQRMHAAIRSQHLNAAGVMGVQTVIRPVAVVAAGSS